MSARRPSVCPDLAHELPLEPIHSRRHRRDAVLMLGALLGRDLLGGSKYWYALFSHRRDDAWKGMLLVQLDNQADDDAARRVLGIVP